jgi:hypothetical protein
MLTGLLRRNFSGASPGARSGFIATASLACAMALSSPAGAASITDDANDFLKTFGGAHNADLDVLSASATFSDSTFHLSATLAGDVRATTPGALYVWGIDRGHGTAVLNQGANPVGAGVTFDSVVIFLPNGAAILSQIGPDGLFGPVTMLAPTISEKTLTVDVSLDALLTLPGTDPDSDVEDFRFNFWPRTGGNVKDGTEVSDFAPGGDDGVGSTFNVPEPGALALMVSGVGLAGMMRRRRSVSAA